MAKPKSKKPKWGELVGNTRHYPLHSYQSAALNSTSRITACFAGTGGGRSCIVRQWILKQLSKLPAKSRILVVSPTYKIFKQSKLLDAFQSAIEATVQQGSYHKTDNIYTCYNKSEIFFRSAENSDSLEGGQYSAQAIDEIGQINYDSWIKASARVGASQGPILLVGTPDVNQWIYDDIYVHCNHLISQDDFGTIKISDDKQILCLQWSSIVNPIYSVKELEEQRRKLHPAQFARRYLGQFSKLEGLVYPNFSDCIIPTHKILPSPAIKTVCGIDWGWSDPCSVVVMCECQDGKIYIVDEIYQSHLPLNLLAEKLLQLKQKWLIETMYCDHSRPEIADQLRKAGLPCKVKNVTSIEVGIGLVDARIRTGYLQCFDSLQNVISEARIYQRKSDRDNHISEKPIDKNNHLMDALRYGVSGLDFGRRLEFKPIDININKTAIDAKIRLGILPEDETLQKELEAKERIRQRAEHFYQLAFGDLDD